MPDTRPPCDLRGIADTTVIVRRVVSTLEAASLSGEALVFVERVKDAPGTNALLQIVRQYVRPVVWA
jgi:hypothetical protein